MSHYPISILSLYTEKDVCENNRYGCLNLLNKETHSWLIYQNYFGDYLCMCFKIVQAFQNMISTY